MKFLSKKVKNFRSLANVWISFGFIEKSIKSERVPYIFWLKISISNRKLNAIKLISILLHQNNMAFSFSMKKKNICLQISKTYEIFSRFSWKITAEKSINLTR